MRWEKLEFHFFYAEYFICFIAENIELVKMGKLIFCCVNGSEKLDRSVC